MNASHPIALFQFSILGPLVSRASLARGVLKAVFKELSSREHKILCSRPAP